jgi:hypothetical protein
VCDRSTSPLRVASFDRPWCPHDITGSSGAPSGGLAGGAPAIHGHFVDPLAARSTKAVLPGIFGM